MAAALVVAPVDTVVGTSIAISGTGFALTTQVTISITAEELPDDVTWKVTSDGAGAWALPGSFAPDAPGIYTVSATDGTSTKTTTVKVSQSE